MIVSCGFNIIKNIFKTKVEASEAVEVTPSWNDGDITTQSDNLILTIQEQQKQIQTDFIYQLYYIYDNTNANNKTNVVNICTTLFESMRTRGFFIGRYNNNDNDTGYIINRYSPGSLSNVVYRDGTFNNGYKFFSVPFYSFNITQNSNQIWLYPRTAAVYNNVTSGTNYVACAEVFVYSPLWIDLFDHIGIIKSVETYNEVLSSIEETNELTYTQAYYTRELVENTYDSLHNSNITTISSSGISQPQVTEPDLSDAFDSITNILTNDNATTKVFTFKLPNNDSFNFSIDPNFLRTSLTRVGGGALVTIIETLWYIGLYGLFIFTYLKIIGALLAGDLDDITGVLSPVNSVVSSSLEVTGAFRTSGGDESAFRIRKG